MRRARTTGSAPAPALFPGEAGFVRLQYVGQAPDRRYWPGPVTGVKYPFGPGEARLVDRRDAEVWLRPVRGEGRAFELSEQRHD